MSKQFRVLNMADTAACPALFDPLLSIAEVVCLPSNQDVLQECLGEFDGYLASLHVKANRSVLENAPRLKVIATPSTGLDHIDMAFAKERGVELLSLKDDIEFLNGITATAELTWGLLSSVVRRLPWAFDAAKQGQWARDEFRGRQLSGKTLGILGYGRLGKMVADYGTAFRMRVLACDRKPVTPAPGVEMVDFETLLRESDVLSIHIHLTEENRELINGAAMAQMKPGAVLLNSSRGAIIDEAALLENLKSGQLAGAGLDVIDGEWSENLHQHPLVQYANSHQNLVITPHIGGVTWESQAMAYERTVSKLQEFLEKKLLSDSRKANAVSGGPDKVSGATQ